MPSKKSSEITREKIKDAFITLYRDNSIEKISIKQLTDLAGVNRATFYSHYMDIYDLMEKIVEEKYNIFCEKLSMAVPVVISGKEFKAQLLDLDDEFFKKNEKWIEVLVGIYGKSNIVERIKENIKIMICDNMGFDIMNIPIELEYTLEYLVSANAGIFTKWIRSGRDIEIDKLAGIIGNAMQTGPVAALMSLKSQNADYAINGFVSQVPKDIP